MIGSTKFVCPICGQPGAACSGGDDHMTRPPISMSLIKGEATAMPQELKEYEYYVGHVQMTAMLTEEMAERLGAKPVGTGDKPNVGEVPNREAERMQTNTRQAEDEGVVASHADGSDTDTTAEKTRTARNKRAS